MAAAFRETKDGQAINRTGADNNFSGRDEPFVGFYDALTGK